LAIGAIKPPGPGWRASLTGRRQLDQGHRYGRRLQHVDGNHVLDFWFWRAQEKARALGHEDRGETGRPMTVGEALSGYEADLRTRGGDSGNLVRVRAHLPPALRDKTVALLGVRHFARMA
jgi:hypothetical protein